MSNLKRILIATAFIVCGLILFCAIMTVNGWDFKKLSTVQYITNEHVISEEFNSIEINATTADVTFLKSNNSENKIVCYENKKLTHQITVTEGVLTVTEKDERTWRDYIGINFESPKICVYLAGEEYENLTVNLTTGDVNIAKGFLLKTLSVEVFTGDVACFASANELLKISSGTGDLSLEKVKCGVVELITSTGDIDGDGIDCDKLEVTVTTGDVELENLSCKSFISNGGTGDILLKNALVEGKLSIERNTGDVELNNSDGGEILIVTTTGDVECSLRSSKVFTVETSSGDKRIPSSNEGGVCEIRTSTGDIDVNIID